MTRRTVLKATALGAFALASGSWLPSAFAADTINVGVLHSLSGTMAISETSLKDVALMAGSWVVVVDSARAILTRPQTQREGHLQSAPTRSSSRRTVRGR